MSLTNPITYYEYLELDKILSAQHPESEKHGIKAHDEMLFIIIHQAYELWFKQVLHELDSAIEIFSGESVAEENVAIAYSRLQRINRIMELVVQQFTILETMTPIDFIEFRDFLNPASGFQSGQFRLLEIKLGLSEKNRLSIDSKGYKARLGEADLNKIEIALKKTSLFDVIERWLENMPFMESGNYKFWEEYRDAVQEMFARDREALNVVGTLSAEEIEQKLRQINAMEESFLALFDEKRYSEIIEKGERRLSQRASLAALFITIYRDYPLLNLPYRLLDAVVEMDKLMTVWRHRHALMVSRMIGSRIGTGGSSGTDYLMRTAMQHRIFTDLSAINSYLIPKRETPELPQDIAQKLRFVFEL